jgi:hypothetical protein
VSGWRAVTGPLTSCPECRAVVPIADQAAHTESHGRADALALFLETWAELIPGLPDDYTCTLTCLEAEAAAGLFRANGYAGTADAVLAAHAAHDTPEDLHSPRMTPQEGPPE